MQERLLCQFTMGTFWILIPLYCQFVCVFLESGHDLPKKTSPFLTGSKVIWQKNEENLRDLEFEITIFSYLQNRPCQECLCKKWAPTAFSQGDELIIMDNPLQLAYCFLACIDQPILRD